jgi:amidophosphoribosyltransferase
MSDFIQHECGIALIRLLKPLSFYAKKYGTAYYGLNKLYLLMEKQHNRGQDGAGIANIKLFPQPGTPYIDIQKSVSNRPIEDVFAKVRKGITSTLALQPHEDNNPIWLKDNAPFTGELFLGHLRYGTYGRNTIDACHPFVRQNNWMTRNLLVAGNFNMTNVDELFDLLVNLGQHPREKADTVTVLEKIGHFLDVENEELFKKYKILGYSNADITERIARNLSIEDILRHAAGDFDGGYAILGMLGHGDAFVLRDPHAIRPAFYYADEEVVVVASERPAIQTAFNLKVEQIKEVSPGHALIIKRDGPVRESRILKAGKRQSCSFERIYFSRGSDKDIYNERKELGHKLAPIVLKSIKYDLQNTVFSFIPNTAEVSFYGLVKGLEDFLNQKKCEDIHKLNGKAEPKKIERILSRRVRVEKIALKDAKLRTFITQDADRDEMVAHVYDITYGTVVPEKDTLVVIDDSIVRGTTLKQSIIRMLDRLGPRKIIIISSAPQIRYPDCYGIDMARLGDFVAFNAAITLWQKSGRQKELNEIERLCREQLKLPRQEQRNIAKLIYEPFSNDQISAQIAALVKPANCHADVEVIFQTIKGLHQSIPNHPGDWYFTGDYPTSGGIRVVNKALLNYFEGRNERAY